LSDRIPERTDDWELEPFADASSAFVFFNSPLRVTVLDKLTWYVLELCDGRSESQIVARVAGASRTEPGRARAAAIVTDRLAVLRRQGLVAP
jgi:hypothetical protein